jgi:hypothetical protein
VGVTRVRAADGSRWVIRTRWLVWPRWRKPNVDLLDGGDLLSGLDLLAGDGPVGAIVAVVVAILLVTGLIVFLLPLIAFGGELLALPFLAVFFRGRRVVEARNEATGERIRRRVRGRDEARAAERELARELQTAPLDQDAVRVLPPASS